MKVMMSGNICLLGIIIFLPGFIIYAIGLDGHKKWRKMGAYIMLVGAIPVFFTLVYVLIYLFQIIWFNKIINV